MGWNGDFAQENACFDPNAERLGAALVRRLRRGERPSITALGIGASIFW